MIKHKKLVIICVAFLLIIVFILIYLPGYSRYQELRMKRQNILNEIERIKNSNETLQRELELLQNDVTHIEKVLRDEMGLVKPGEVIYKVVEESPEDSSVDTDNHE